MFHPARMSLAALVFTAGLAAPVASAQMWNSPTAGLWNDPANWSPAVVPNSVGAVAVIASPGEGGTLMNVGTITFDAPVTVGSLDIDMGISGPSVFLNPIELIFDNGGGADVFIDADSPFATNITGPITLMGNLMSSWTASNAEITGVISGDYGITHHGAHAGGQLNLRGTNTYTGETRCTNGRISITRSANLGSHDVGTTIVGPGVLIARAPFPTVYEDEALTLEDGGFLWMHSGTRWNETITLVNSGNVAAWFDNSISEVSGLITGGVLIRSSAQSRSGDPLQESIVTLSNGANDYTGGTIIRSGILAIPSDSVLGAAGTPITFDTQGFSEGSPVLLTTGDMIIGRDISMVDPGTLRADENTVASYTGEISGSSLTIGGIAGGIALSSGLPDWNGTVVLQASNSYSGGTTVERGTLIVDNFLGSATGSGPVVVEEPATLAGDGIVSGAVNMTAGGFLRPGAPVGSIILGSLTQGPLSVTVIEITNDNPGQFDKVICGAPSTIDGELVVLVDPGFTPDIGDTFDIVTAPALSGVFSTLTIPDGYEVEYEANRARLVFAGTVSDCPADFSGDGMVDSEDLATLLAGWDMDGPSNLDGKGVTDSSDLAIVLASWGPCP